jgi:antitoxin component YwqK of YwqJK toxin-antitoxin module
MKNFFSYLFFSTCLLAGTSLYAQEDSTQTAAPLDKPIEKPLTIDINAQEEEEIPKKKRKKNVFYDLKTRKAFAKSGYGQNEKIEIFHILKEWQEPDPYVRDIYWYEFKSKSVKKGGQPTPDKGMLLHGPYRVEKDGEIIEKGIFYKGTKHGRWITYRKMYDYMALDTKEKYIKGWPKESKITYYDRKATKLKEVIPVEYGKKEGNYYLFFPTGEIAVRGEFQYDEKVGTWTEYYQQRQRRKKQIQYAPDPWAKSFDPFIAQEWDKEGKLIYERKK